jgi:MarR family transcriptional regulator, organic hydroperoxide resistance regulator
MLPAMFESQIARLLEAYPAIYLACHRRHVRDDETGEIVTAHQASILDHLDPREPTTLSRLAEHLGIGRSAMSIQVSRLKRRGFVRRGSIRGDRRKAGLTLTETGQRIKKHNTVLDPKLVVALLTSMPHAERESALRGLECIARYAVTLIRRRSRTREK